MAEQLFCYRERTLPNGKKVIVREAFNENDAEGVLSVMPNTPEMARNTKDEASFVVQRLIRMTEEGKATAEERAAWERLVERARGLGVDPRELTDTTKPKRVIEP